MREHSVRMHYCKFGITKRNRLAHNNKTNKKKFHLWGQSPFAIISAIYVPSESRPGKRSFKQACCGLSFSTPTVPLWSQLSSLQEALSSTWTSLTATRNSQWEATKRTFTNKHGEQTNTQKHIITQTRDERQTKPHKHKRGSLINTQKKYTNINTHTHTQRRTGTYTQKRVHWRTHTRICLQNDVQPPNDSKKKRVKYPPHSGQL